MKKILSNISWLAIGRMGQILVSATVGVLLARYLGPDLFGTMNYVFALVGLFVVVVPLGLPSVLVREMVRDSEKTESMLGVALVLQILASLIIYLVVVTIALATESPGSDTFLLTAVYGLFILGKPFGLYRSWFEAGIIVKHIVRIELALLFLSSLLKLMAIWLDAGLLLFVIIQMVSNGIGTFGVAWIYRRVSGLSLRTTWDFKAGRELLAQSWPLAVSALGLVLYLKVDQVMLGQIATAADVGIYSAALRLSEVWYSVPVILMSTLFPAIVKAHESDELMFRRRISTVLDLFAGISVTVALLMFLVSDCVITTLFGPSYEEASDVLAVHIWSSVFIFFGTVTGKWYLLHDIQHLNILRNFLGAGVNIALNFWAIPRYGASGAAIATLVSYSFANYFADLLTSKSRPLFWVKTKSLLFWPHLLWRPREKFRRLMTKGESS